MRLGPAWSFPAARRGGFLGGHLLTRRRLQHSEQDALRVGEVRVQTDVPDVVRSLHQAAAGRFDFS